MGKVDLSRVGLRADLIPVRCVSPNLTGTVARPSTI
jgi:hypothetical protein